MTTGRTFPDKLSFLTTLHSKLDNTTTHCMINIIVQPFPSPNHLSLYIFNVTSLSFILISSCTYSGQHNYYRIKRYCELLNSTKKHYWTWSEGDLLLRIGLGM